MEGFLFLVDSILLVLLVYWSAKNDKNSTKSPIEGIFAYTETRRVEKAEKKDKNTNREIK